MQQYIPRVVNFEEYDYDIIKRAMREKGLGDKGFSAAVRLIIREWEAFRNGLLFTQPYDPPEQG